MNVTEFWAKYADEPYELIAGTMIETPEKGERAIEIITRIAEELEQVIDNQDTNDILAGSVGCALSDDTLLAADLTVIKEEKMAQISDPESYVPFAPDFVIEVGSDQAMIDQRVDLYLKAGTTLIWIVDPEKESVTVYKNGEAPRLMSKEDNLHGGGVISGLTIPVERFFHDA